jgi:hypothetical protein
MARPDKEIVFLCFCVCKRDLNGDCREHHGEESSDYTMPPINIDTDEKNPVVDSGVKAFELVSIPSKVLCLELFLKLFVLQNTPDNEETNQVFKLQ